MNSNQYKFRFAQLHRTGFSSSRIFSTTELVSANFRFAAAIPVMPHNISPPRPKQNHPYSDRRSARIERAMVSRNIWITAAGLLDRCARGRCHSLIGYGGQTENELTQIFSRCEVQKRPASTEKTVILKQRSNAGSLDAILRRSVTWPCNIGGLRSGADVEKETTCVYRGPSCRNFTLFQDASWMSMDSCVHLTLALNLLWPSSQQMRCLLTKACLT